VDADGIRGFFQLQHKVYMRTGEPCLVCGTPIRKIAIGGRSTHFCPRCQR
jgi:formamidopyrimidine-DNA glycosylase